MAHGGYGYVEYVRHLTDATIARPEFRYDLCRHEERGGKRVRPYLLGVCPSRREGVPSLNDPSNLPVSQVLVRVDVEALRHLARRYVPTASSSSSATL